MFNDPEMVRTGDFLRFFQMTLGGTYTPIQKKIGSSWLLKEILANLKKAINQESPKISIFSGHDWTMLNLLGGLNFFNMDCLLHHFVHNTTSDTCITSFPTFASNMVVELWKN